MNALFLLFLRSNMERILSVGIILAFVLFVPLTGAASADQAVKEMPLNPYGSAWNVHADAQGNLWINVAVTNDAGAGQLWRLNASDSGVNVYSVMGMPKDAYPDASGGVWWVDRVGKTLNHLDSVSAATQKWDLAASLPTGFALYGVAVDSSGKVWATDSSTANVYRFDPNIRRLCSYALPANATGSYPAFSGTTLWLGDNTNGLLIRIDSDQNKLTWWQLPGSGNTQSKPEDVALDSSGGVWYTDDGLGQIGRLDPADGLRIYALPAGNLPIELAISGEKIWYTERSLPSLGVLDPGSAAHATKTVISGNIDLTPTCIDLAMPATGTAGKSTSAPTWQANTYPILATSIGWTIYQIPEGPEGAYPWGIAVTGKVYYVDNIRKVLGRIFLQTPAQVTACKVKDQDGKLATTADRTPVAGWTLYLTVDGVRQLPGQTTVVDGCTTWNELASSPTYGVEEEPGTQWVALAGTSHSFGPSEPGGSYQYTFINAQKSQQQVFLPLLVR